MADIDSGRIKYLDGLRGWAALLVCMGHTALAFTYDAPNQPKVLQYIQNGYFRILFDGGLSVKIFFVLSGIVLSTAFIKTLDASKLAALLIKRIPRLGIPILIMALVSHILMKAGLMYNFSAIEVLGKNTWLSWCYNFDSTIVRAAGYTFLSSFFGGGNPYSTALWTMPHEMIGSIFTAIVLLSAMHIKRSKIYIPLLLLLGGLIVFAYRAGGASAYSSTLICFLFGIIFSYIMNKNKIKRMPFIIKPVLFLCTIYLYYNKYNLDLKVNLTAALIVFLVIVSQTAQKIFSMKLSVFLGKISFPLYVIHMTVICSLTSFLITKSYDPDNTKLVLLYFIISIAASIICACILYPAEKFSIMFSGKIYEYLSSENKIDIKEAIRTIKNARGSCRKTI